MKSAGGEDWDYNKGNKGLSSALTFLQRSLLLQGYCMLNAPSPPSSISPLVAAKRRSLDGVARGA